jgi:hypothetical protein
MRQQREFEPGDRVVWVDIVGKAYLGKLVRRNTEFRNDYWFVDWEDGAYSTRSFGEASMLKIFEQEKR